MLTDYSFGTEYRTGEVDPVELFYKPCLKHSINYWRAVGYFKSSIFLLIGKELIDFIDSQGKIYIICSPQLDDDDIKAIEKGYKNRDNIISTRLVLELEQLLESTDTNLKSRILSTLISACVLDIKIAFRNNYQGIYHEKMGIFEDSDGNKVSFKGSSNETWSGWHSDGNFESIEVFCSWRNNDEKSRVVKHLDYFERLWNNDVKNILTLELPSAVRNKMLQASFDSIESVKKYLERDKGGKDIRDDSKKPFEHQIEAISEWQKNGKKGILEHATGSGKTFTAIMAIREHVNEGKPVLIVVPGELLLKQWKAEIEAEFQNVALLIAGAGYTSWKKPKRLSSVTSSLINDRPRIVLSTMQTARTADFINKINDGDHLMIVADEVHEIGSKKNSNILKLNTGVRLGLSATPYRYGDPEGTEKIISYFGGIVQPTFTLNEAIKAGRLVEYEYYPTPLHLNDRESEEWDNLSKKISREIAKLPDISEGNIQITDKIKLLLIHRRRIAKKAEAKVLYTYNVIKEHYQEGQKWLIYCEDIDQLEEVLTKLQEGDFPAIKYYSEMGDAAATSLNWFVDFGGILVSIRCLDQGIDIPDISHAIIIASSQNPRQFIQRRGRVLRKFPGKYKAVIYDAIVTPSSITKEPTQLSLVKSELARAIEFSENSINKFADAQLRDIVANIGLDPDEFWNTGIEED